MASKIFIFCTTVFLFLVELDKKIVFSDVIGMEHMLRMKKFSTSDIHFNMTIFIPVCVVGLCVGFNTYKETNKDAKPVSYNIVCVSFAITNQRQ